MERHCYIVTYDLCSPGCDYQMLYQAIKSYVHWGKITESTWAIVSELDAYAIRDQLMQYIGSNDRLMVVKSGQHAAWVNAMAPNEWLKQNLIK